MRATTAPDPVADGDAPGGATLALTEVAVTAREPGGGTMNILEIPALTVPPASTLAVAGPSGAGKTTLLHVIAGLLQPARGRVTFGGADIGALSGGARDRWRRRCVGLVFQDFALLHELDMLDNILLPASFDHWRIPAALRQRALDLLRRVGLTPSRRPVHSLSRGEQQRVALARALLRRPALILADEPTASLDAESGASVAALLMSTAREDGATVIVASHDARIIDRLDRVARLDRGRLAAGLGRA
jgi:putative ABC transport system ATP-binding protein